MLQATGRPARLRYRLAGFDVLQPGDYVACAVSGERIPLADLRYWSAEYQEAYASAAISTRRHEERRGRG